MALLKAEEIYLVARHAGFSPSQARTMTAIALAESAGDPTAHNSSGEDSRGLWQINLAVHDDLVALGDPTNPLVNARMAFAVSQQGQDITPWTVTHEDKEALYLHYREEADRAGATVEPGVAARGSWEPPLNYDSAAVAAGQPLELAPPPLPNEFRGDGDAFLTVAASQVGHQVLPSSDVDLFIERALAQQGDSYVFGAEADLSDIDPDAFDCSELVQWAAAQAGVQVSDGSWIQYQQVRSGGGEMSIEQALRTPGALLFRFGSSPEGSDRPSGAHVAISLGDGRTIEARGSAYGVGVFDADDRGWTHAGVIPELTGATRVPLVTGPVQRGADSDGDLILDEVEMAIGTDPFSADTDRDGFVDSVELLDYRTDPFDGGDNARDDSLRDAGLPVAPPPPPEPVTAAAYPDPVRPAAVQPVPQALVRPAPVEPAEPVVPLEERVAAVPAAPEESAESLEPSGDDAPDGADDGAAAGGDGSDRSGVDPEAPLDAAAEPDPAPLEAESPEVDVELDVEPEPLVIDDMGVDDGLSGGSPLDGGDDDLDESGSGLDDGLDDLGPDPALP